MHRATQNFNPAQLKERVPLRRIVKAAHERGEHFIPIWDISMARREALKRFILRLRRRNLEHLAPRIYLAPLIDEADRYREAFQLDMSEKFSSEYYDWMKERNLI